MELAAFHIGLLEGQPSDLYRGLSADIGRITEAINELGAVVLCRMAFGIKSPLPPIKRMDRHQQIANLQTHGYTTKEITGFLRRGLNTPSYPHAPGTAKEDVRFWRCHGKVRSGYLTNPLGPGPPLDP